MTGILVAFLSAICQTSKDLVSKRLASEVDGTVSACASFLYALPFYVVLLLVLYLLGLEDFAFSTTFFVLVVARAVTDTAAEWLKMHAFAYGDISLVSSFLALSPLFLLVVSPLITGDELPVLGGVAVGFTVVGSLILVVRPGERPLGEQKKGIFYALGAALCFSINSCFDRLAVQFASPTLSGFAMTLLSGAFLMIPVLAKPERVRDLRLHAKSFSIRGVMEVAFMVTKLIALQYMQAPYVAGINKTHVIFSIIGGKVFFKEEQFLRRMLAAVTILAGVLLVIFVKLQS